MSESIKETILRIVIANSGHALSRQDAKHNVNRMTNVELLMHIDDALKNYGVLKTGPVSP